MKKPGLVRGRGRKLLDELRGLISSVPFPVAGGSTQSTGFTGFITYEQDMRQWLSAVEAVLRGILLEGVEAEDGSIPRVDLDYEDPERMLVAMREWIKAREQEGWANFPIHRGRTPTIVERYHALAPDRPEGL